jgi:hypothetical protein
MRRKPKNWKIKLKNLKINGTQSNHSCELTTLLYL